MQPIHAINIDKPKINKTSVMYTYLVNLGMWFCILPLGESSYIVFPVSDDEGSGLL